MQRGHNRQTVFVADEDYRYYLDNLDFFKKEFGCKGYHKETRTKNKEVVRKTGFKNRLAFSGMPGNRFFYRLVVCITLNKQSVCYSMGSVLSCLYDKVVS